MGLMISHMFNNDFFRIFPLFRVHPFGYNFSFPMYDDFSYVQNETTSLIPLDIRDKGKRCEIKMYVPGISRENLQCLEVVSASKRIKEKIDDYTTRYVQEESELYHIQAIPIPSNVRVKDIGVN
ncbi:small heat shock protein, putative [Plasmodium yoelii]|uniref:Small heat shock protein, putative n=1 Tax=Plasmodium yoelii TaxID=5861 RepID=A0A4V0KT00_PLAYE|nr:small heat shock protein, putative [Plasmodium yoelii]VTZ81361.1 small heat shock protein, putative [Plasmodium yoelii]|eukprot:XP_034493626.1 small heat shock protein, putative [Plasmodium yoelii]